MLQIIILGIIQGIAEFLPISSSAHLIIFRELFGIGKDLVGNMEMSFDVALHFGTLLAIGIYFFKDFVNMIFSGITKGTKEKDGKIFWAVVVATIPAAIIGLIFEETVEKVLRGKYILIGIALIAMGIIMYVSDKKSKQEKSVGSITIKDALLIGCSQVLALVPGFSRSGTTITSARLLKLNREDAAKFSFFLSAPVVCGAVVLKIFDSETLSLIYNNLSTFIIGVASSFIMGIICIKFLLKYLKKNDFKLFMWYRIILGIVVILLSVLK